MATGGVVYKDLLPIPHETEPEKEETHTSLTDKPTESHALAMAAQEQPLEEKGAAQIDHEEEVVNLGWNEAPQDIASPLVGGISNEDVWVLVRRFNKVGFEMFGSIRCAKQQCSKCTMSRRSQTRLREAWT